VTKTYFGKDGLKRASESIRTDFVSITKGKNGKNQPLKNKFEDYIEQLTTQLAVSLEAEVSEIIKAHYKAALDEVKKAIIAGVPGTEGDVGKAKTLVSNVKGWRSYNPRYYTRKKRENRTNAKKFWKKTGDTGRAFNKFSVQYRKKVQHMKGATKLHEARKLKSPASVYRVAVDFTLPKPHLGGAFFTTIFHDAFFEQKSTPVSRAFAMSNIGGSDMEIIIALIEGNDGTRIYRPMIAKIMKKHGQAFHREYNALMQEIQQRSLQDTLAAGGIRGLKIK